MAQSGKAEGGPRPLYAWGTNVSGSLGNNTTVSTSSPIQIGTSLWTAVAVTKNCLVSDQGGMRLSWGIRSDNTLWSWGSNANNSMWPDYLSDTCSWTAVHSGGNWGGVRSDGTAWFAGGGNRGQLGNNNYASFNSPVLVSNGYTDWCRVWALTGTGFGIRTNGEFYGWGCGAYGASGRCTTGNTRTPGRAVIAAGNVCTAGVNPLTQRASFVIGTDGGLWAWGANCGGMTGVGIGTNTSLAVPTRVGTSAWSMVGVSGFTTAAIRQDGTLWTWGCNDGGWTRGNAALSSNCSPVQIGTVNTWREIFGAPGYAFLGRRSDGTIWAWGCNYGGKLGFGDFLRRSEPTQIGTLTFDRVFSESGGGSFQALRSGAMWMWGAGYVASWGDSSIRQCPVQVSASGYSDNCCLHLGGNTSIRDNQIAYVWAAASGTIGRASSNSPVIVGGIQFPAASSPVQVASGSWSCVTSAFGAVLALKTGGTLWAWGCNAQTRLGLANTFEGVVQSPIQVGTGTWNRICIQRYASAGINTAGNLFVWGQASAIFTEANATALQSWTVVSTGNAGGTSTAGGIAFAIRSNGTLWSWGNNRYGSLGLGDFINRSSPVQIGASSWKAVYAGRNRVAAIRCDGTLWAWGDNAVGALGLNDSSPVCRSSPTQIGTSIWSAVSVHSCGMLAIRQDRTLWTWGINNGATLGMNNTLSYSSPVQIGTSLWTAASGASVGTTPTAGAIRCDGALFTWGTNTCFALGDGTTITRSSPVQIAAGSTFCLLKMGNWCNSAAIRCDGGLLTWGNGRYGRLGLGATTQVIAPNQVGSSAWSMVTILQCGATMLAIRQDGTLWSWGCAQPPAGRGAVYTAVCSPVQIGTSSWSFLGRGGGSEGSVANAIRQGGTLFVWGCGTFGSAGTNQTTVIPRSPVTIGGNFLGSNCPVQIGTSIWSAVTMLNRGTSAVAIRQDRTLWAWGCNYAGRLGLNNTIDRSSPVQIGTSSWAQVSAYAGNVHALRCDGTLWGWGAGAAIGDNQNVNKSSPVQIGTSCYRFLDSGNQTVGAIRADRTLWTWGTACFGALGLNDNVFRSSPVQVGTSCWTTVAMGSGQGFGTCFSSLGLLDA